MLDLAADPAPCPGGMYEECANLCGIVPLADGSSLPIVRMSKLI